MALERPEESPLPATAPDILEQRQETDAPAPSLDRASAPRRSTTPTPPAPKPVANGQQLPAPKRETESIIDTFRKSLIATGYSSKANTFMVEARKAELKGDKEKEAFYREQAGRLYQAAQNSQPDMNSISKVQDLGDFGKLIANFAGTTTPSVVASIAAGTLGGGVARVFKPALKSVPTLARNAEALGATAATSYSMYDDVKGSIIAQQEADPVISQLPVQERERNAMLTTAGSLSLESIVPAAIGTRASRKLVGAARRDLSPEDLIKSNRGKWIENIGGEGLTEVSQNYLEDISLDLQNPDRPNTASASDYIDALLGGFVGGASGHAFGRSLEGVGSILSSRGGIENAFSNYKPVNKQAGHISGRNIQNQRIATNELFYGTDQSDDAFLTFLPEVTAAIRDSGFNLHDLLDGKKLSKMEDRNMAKKMQAMGVLALTIDNPEITDQEFQTRRQYAAKLLFPEHENDVALELVDEMFDIYTEANAETSSSIDVQDTPETSPENLNYREPDIVVDGYDPVDTFAFDQDTSGDSSNLNVKLKATDVTDIWARPDQAARPSKSETSVIHRPAYNNAPWEMSLLDKEIKADDQADVESVTDWLTRNNHDPVEYGKLLLEDLYERRNRNRQDPQAVLEEKGKATTEGTPFSQEQVLTTLQEQIDNLESVLDMSEQEGSPRAVAQYLKNNYSKGAVKSVSPSKDLALSPTDLRDFSKLNRRESGQKSRERAQAGRLFPLIYANGKDDSNGYEIHPSALNTNDKGEGGWVAESIAQTMAAKGRAGKNVFQSGSKQDDLNIRRMYSEGIAAAIQTLGIVGFLDPKSVKKGKVVGPIVPYTIKGRNAAGQEVGEARTAIPDVPITANWTKATDAAVAREEKYRKGSPLEAIENSGARDVARQELDQFDTSKDKSITAAFKGQEKTNTFNATPRLTKLLQTALDRVMDALPEGVRRDLGRQGANRAIDNVLEYVDRVTESRTNPEEFSQDKAALQAEIDRIKSSEDYNLEVPTAEGTKKQRKIKAELQARKDKAVEAVKRLQKQLNPLTRDTVQNLSDETAPKGSVRAAMEFVQAVRDTMEGMQRRIKGYDQDINMIKNTIDTFTKENKKKAYNKTKLGDNVKFELHTSDKTRTFDTIGEARAFSQKLYRAQTQLKEIQKQLSDSLAGVDEHVEAALQESTEGLYKESTQESLEKLDQSSLQDETQYDEAAKDTLRKPEQLSEQGQEQKKGLVKPKRPTAKDTIEEKVVPLSEKRTPAGIKSLRKALRSKLPIEKRVQSVEEQVRKVFRVFLTEGNRVPKGTRDAKGRFVNRGEYAPVTSVGVNVQDLQASDIAYLMIGDLAAIQGGSQNKTSYFNRIISKGADVYLASHSKVSLEEFTQFMDTQGYMAWTSDPRMFSPINYRTMERLMGDYQTALDDYNNTQGRIADAITNPEDSLDAQLAAQRNRLWGGKDASQQARQEQEESGEVTKETLQNLRDELVRNQREVEAAITNLSDFGSKEAREAFYGYLKNLDFSDDAQRARNDLHRTIHANRRVIARMKELLDGDKYQLTKEEVKRIQSDPDFAVAVAYQMWANGDLNISDTALTWFKKIITHFLNIVGFTLSHQYGEQLLTAFQTGELKTLSDARTVYRINQRTFDNAYNSITTELNKLGRRVSRGSGDVLRETKVPELMRLANLFQVAETDDSSSELGFIPARRMMQGQFNTALSQIAKKYTDNELEVGFEEFRTGKVTTKAGRAIRDLNTKLYKYMEEAGVKVLDGKRKTVPITARNRRAPIVFNTAAISKDRDGFVKTLKKLGLSDAQAEQVLKGALWDVGSLDFSDSSYDLGRPPDGSELYSGLLDGITTANRKELAKYERSDPLEAYYTFIRQATHRAEMTRYLGHNGEKIDKALQAAKIKGLNRDQVEFIRTRTIPSLMGTMSYNMSPQLRKLQGGILTMQNLAILPLAIFASVVDIMGIPLRTGKMTDAWTAFKDGLKGVVNSSDPAFNMAELLGINDGQMLYDRIGDTYNELIDSPFLRKINHKFFLWNGLEGWTKGIRVSAMRAAISYLSDHRDNAQKLEDIGLKKSDLTFTPEGLLDVENNRKVQEAIYKFVDSTVLRPSATHRPAWGSDPRFLLIWHLKQFTFSFHNVFYKRVANSVMEHGWKNATLIPFLAMIPVMMASDFARNIIAPSANYESLNFGELVLRSIQRSSIAGIGTFGFDILQDAKFDEYPGTSLLGPTFDSADKFIDSGLSSGLFRLTPGYALTKTWID